MTSGTMPSRCEDPHDADMRPAAGGAAAESEADLQPRAGLAFGSDLGHAFSASTVAEPERATGDPVPQHDLNFPTRWRSSHTPMKAL